MKIIMEFMAYEGTPESIIDELRQDAFDSFEDTESYLEHMRQNFERMTETPCVLPDGGIREKAKAMLEHLAAIDALEIAETD